MKPCCTVLKTASIQAAHTIPSTNQSGFHTHMHTNLYTMPMTQKLELSKTKEIIFILDKVNQNTLNSKIEIFHIKRNYKERTNWKF